MKKTPPLKMVISIEEDVPSNVDPITGNDQKAIEINGEKPIAKPGEDTVGDEPKPLPAGENSIETALQAPKGEDNEDAKGVPSADTLAKEGAKEGVPVVPTQETPSVESRQFGAQTLRNQARHLLKLAASMEGDDTPVAISDNPQAEDGFPTEEGGKPKDATPIAADADSTAAPKTTEVIEINDSMSVEPDVSEEIDAVFKEAEYDFDQEQEAAAAVERLELTEATVQKLVDTGTGTEETLQLIDDAVKPALESLGIRLVNPSMESYGKLSVHQKHRVALESIKGALNAYAQDRDLANTEHNVGMFQALSSLEESDAYLRKNFDEAQKWIAEFKKTGKIRTTGKLDLVALWQFFSTGSGQEKDLSQAAQRDLAITKEILEGYNTHAFGTLKKFSELIAKIPKDAEEMRNLAKRIETLKSPANSFPRQALGEGKLLGVHGYEIQTGSSRKVLSLDGVPLPHLAELATAKTPSQTSSFKHGLKKTVAYFNPFEAAGTNKVDVKATDADTMIKLGRGYLDAIQVFAKHANEYEDTISEQIKENLKKLGKAVTSKEDKAVVEQIRQTAKNLENAWYSPCFKESLRAQKAVRYCFLAVKGILHYSTK